MKQIISYFLFTVLVAQSLDDRYHSVEEIYGVLDSLDIVTLSFLIKKKFKVDINVNEKNIKVFNSYNELLKKLK